MPGKVVDSAPHITITLHGAHLGISFPYSKSYFEAIKKVKGIRYSKQDKLWMLPLEKFENFKRSQVLGEAPLHMNFEAADFEKELQKKARLRKAAWSRICANPFSVTKEDIKNAELDCHFTFCKERQTLLVHTSKGSGLQTKLKNVHYLIHIPGIHAFIVPLKYFHRFLKELRSWRTRFAVAREVTPYLEPGKDIRKELFSRVARYYELSRILAEKAFLSPFVAANGNDYIISGACDEQLKLLLPELRHPSRRKKAVEALSYDTLLSVLWRSLEEDIDLFFEENLTASLKKKNRVDKNFHQGSLYFAAAVSAWIRWKGTSLLLLAKDRELPEELLTICKTSGVFVHVAALNDVFAYRFNDEDLESCFTHIQSLVEFPFSNAFYTHRTQLNERDKLYAHMQNLRTLRDTDVDLVNKELKADLYPHQRVAVSWMLDVDSGLLGDDMGLGKTLSVLTAFEESRYRSACDFLLVIAPQSLLENWKRETDYWFSQIRMMRLAKTKTKRQKDLEKLATYRLKPQCLVLNFELLRVEDVFEGLLKLCKERDVFLCIDESQRAKNPRSKTFLALKQLAPHCNKRFLLSGTPLPRDIADIWSQMYLIDGGKRFGEAFYTWLSQIAELGTRYSEYAVKKYRQKEVDACIARVHEVLLRRKKEEVIDLPKKLFSYRDIELKGSQKKSYDDVREELLVRISKTDGESFIKEIDSILEEYLRAVQIASNPRLVDEQWKGEPAKFQELDLLLQEIVSEKEEKLIIWTNYRGNVDELQERYSHLGVKPFSGAVHPTDRAKTVEEFQDKDSGLRVLVAIPAAGGVGITLTAARTAIYLDKTWNAEHWMQSIDRIHRIGQEHVVNIISLHACGVDRYIAKNLKKKMELQAELLGDTKAKKRASSIDYPSRDELLSALQ